MLLGVKKRKQKVRAFIFVLRLLIADSPIVLNRHKRRGGDPLGGFFITESKDSFKTLPPPSQVNGPQDNLVQGP